MPRSKTKFITIYSNTAESKINFKNDISSKRICVASLQKGPLVAKIKK